MKRGIKLKSITLDGCQEKKLRAATLNVPGIVGMGKACELVMDNLNANISKMASLQDRLIGSLIKEKGIRLNGPRNNSAPNNVNLNVRPIESVELLYALDKPGMELP